MNTAMDTALSTFGPTSRTSCGWLANTGGSGCSQNTLHMLTFIMQRRIADPERRNITVVVHPAEKDF